MSYVQSGLSEVSHLGPALVFSVVVLKVEPDMSILTGFKVLNCSATRGYF